MRVAIRHPKDFWSGVAFMACGIAFGVVAQDYEFGRTTRMGPGYFPTVLSALLALVGAFTVARSFVIEGRPLRGFAPRAIVLVLGSVIFFGITVRGLGLAFVLPGVVLISALASVYSRGRSMVPLALGLTVFCILVFARALGLPIPVIGAWLGG